jgi:hypothetical protein
VVTCQPVEARDKQCRLMQLAAVERPAQLRPLLITYPVESSVALRISGSGPFAKIGRNAVVNHSRR